MPSPQDGAMHFASDNWAGAAPEIVESIAREAGRFGRAYGDSEIDRRVTAEFSAIFEREVSVFFVGTGTAANGLALASVNRPGGAVFCHRDSHIADHECGGVEHQTGGARLIGLDGPVGKIDPERLRAAITRFVPGSVYLGQPMAVSITQQSEAGGIYSVEEIESIAGLARERRLPLHMDGARFANALVRLDVSPAEITWKAGIDILSFGASKNGCIAAEALIFFDPAMANEMPYLRQRAGQLFSKSRFIAAQFDAYFKDGLWLKLARHANEIANRLRAGLEESGRAREAWATEGNEVFVVLERTDAERLRSRGAFFHETPEPHGANAGLRGGESIFRLVTSFATTSEDVDSFLRELAG